MVIRFICPNGHQLSAPEDRAGKPAKCPKCQTAFLVPDADEEAGADEEVGADEEAGAEDGNAAAVQGEEEAASGSPRGPHRPTAAPAPQANRDVIVFLCPNGHKLNGPASLKGRPGQCPHCNARFIIPDDEDEDDDDEFAEEVELIDDEVVEEVSGISVIHDRGIQNGHALEKLLAIFQMPGEAQLSFEIHLKDGKTVRAGQLSHPLSQLGFAVCVEQNEQESPVISIIRWEEISRVTIRGLDRLPPEWS